MLTPETHAPAEVVFTQSNEASEVTAPECGLAETPELAQQETEKAAPSVYELKVQPVTGQPAQDEAGQRSSILPIALAVVLAVGAGGVIWFWRRHKVS